MCQYSPVVSARVRDVQAAAQFASDADRDPERARTCQNRDAAAWIHQGRVDALDVLRKTLLLLLNTDHLICDYGSKCHNSVLLRDANTKFGPTAADTT